MKKVFLLMLCFAFVACSTESTSDDTDEEGDAEDVTQADGDAGDPAEDHDEEDAAEPDGEHDAEEDHHEDAEEDHYEDAEEDHHEEMTDVEDVTEEDPAEDPVEEDPAEDMVEEDPVEEDPVEEDPAEEDPVEEDPAEEDPGIEDVEEEELPPTCPNTFLELDGDNDHATVDDSDALTLGADATIEIWVRFDNPSGGNQRILSKWGTSATQNEYVLDIRSGKVNFVASNGVSPEENHSIGFSIDLLPVGEWVHLAGVVDSTAHEVRILLNGTVMDSESTSETFAFSNNERNFKIGYGYFDPSHLDGAVTELRLWNAAKSEADILEKMYCRLHGTEPGLAAYYPINEGDPETSITDLTGNAPDGALAGGANWVTDDMLICDECETPMCDHNFLDFDGDGDYIYMADHDSFSFTNDMSIELWLRPDDITTDTFQSILTKYGPSPTTREYYLIMYANRIECAVNAGVDPETKYLVNLTFDLLTEGEWAHIACIHDTSVPELRWVLNGTTVSQTPTDAGFTFSNTDYGFRIARHYTASTYFLDGGMRELRMWNVARSDAEIQEAMYCILNGDETGLQVYYPMNEGDPAATIMDLTGSAPDGPITNAVWDTLSYTCVSCP